MLHSYDLSKQNTETNDDTLFSSEQISAAAKWWSINIGTFGTQALILLIDEKLYWEEPMRLYPKISFGQEQLFQNTLIQKLSEKCNNKINSNDNITGSISTSLLDDEIFESLKIAGIQLWGLDKARNDETLKKKYQLQSKHHLFTFITLDGKVTYENSLQNQAYGRTGLVYQADKNKAKKK